MADVRYGQIWKDNDPRYTKVRFVKVMEVNTGYAVIMRVNEDGSSYFSEHRRPARRSRKALRCFGALGASGMTWVRDGFPGIDIDAAHTPASTSHGATK